MCTRGLGKYFILQEYGKIITSSQGVIELFINYLGIVIDSEMSLTPLCKNIQKRIVDKIYMLCKLGKFLNYKASI